MNDHAKLINNLSIKVANYRQIQAIHNTVMFKYLNSANLLNNSKTFAVRHITFLKFHTYIF